MIVYEVRYILGIVSEIVYRTVLLICDLGDLRARERDEKTLNFILEEMFGL